MELLNRTDVEPGFFSGFGAAPSVPALAADEAPPVVQPLVLEVRTRGQVSVRTLTGRALIGRQDRPRGIFPEIDLHADTAVSRRHAAIVFREGQYWICDLESLNGTTLNQLELTPRRHFPLEQGDQLFLGEFTCLRIIQAPVPGYTSDRLAAGPADSLGGARAELPAPPVSEDPDERQALELIRELMAD